MGGFAKGLAVLEAFGRRGTGMTIADTARLTGLDRATARRCLLTLEQLGYATHDGKFFSLTVRVLALGHAYLASAPLPSQLQPFLEQLSAAHEESCSASTLDGTDIIYIARASQRRVMSIGLGVGSRLPAYCASMGRVLLAALPDAEVMAILDRSRLRANTPKTIVDKAALLAEIARVREQGYALIDEELEIGLRSIAIPIYNASRATVAAINTGVQTSRLSCEQLRRDILPRMIDVQRQLRSCLTST